MAGGRLMQGRLMRGPVVVGVLVAAATGCRGARVVQTEAPCRSVAHQAEAWMAAAPPAEREAALRVAVELIDQCQSGAWSTPGRACVATARSLADAASCATVHLVRRSSAPAARHGLTPAGRQPDEVTDDAVDDDDQSIP